MTVVSFSGYRPAPRYDSEAWVSVRIEEGPSSTGPWTVIDTIPLDPAPDPTNPPAYSFTTEQATLVDGWYRVTFLDASGDTSLTAPVFYSAATGDFPPPYIIRAGVLPTVADVALLLRTRTVAGLNTGLGADSGSGEVTTFTETTRPSAAEVLALIEQSADEVLSQLPTRAEVQYHQAITRTIARGAAVLVELSFFRESTESPLVAALAADLQALKAVIPREVAIATELSEREQRELAQRRDIPV